MENQTGKIWFITGISRGLGQSLATAAMSRGHFVIGTFRQPAQVAAFNQAHAGRGYAFELDVTQSDRITQVAAAVTDRFGRVDVLVNNAGYGFAGAIEEATEAEIREVFDTNFFGALRLTQAFLPLLRGQKRGHIVQISSHGGVKAFPGFGVYNASKFALEGASEALAAEIAPLGIKLTLVEPGPFRTGFAGEAFRQAATRLSDYEATAGAFRQRMAQVDGKQEGDPDKAAEAILQITELENPPLRLPLGKIALASITAKLESVQRDLEAWQEVAAKAVY